MSKQLKIFMTLFKFLIIAWTVIIFSFLLHALWQNYKFAEDLALNEAKTSFKKDLAYRTWIASHGGVYVPATQRTPPNPYLEHIPNRDLSTLDGQRLTLMNPAYTLRQMMKDYSKLYGNKAKITSHILLNPINKPDAWEEKALHTAEETRSIFHEIQKIDGEKYMRLLNPLVTKESCLKCHAFQGYKVGDIRGGISIAILLEPFYAQAMQNTLLTLIQYFLIWLFGIVGLIFGMRKTQEIVDDRIRQYEQNIYSLVDVIEKRDSYTGGHSQRVSNYSALLAKELDLDSESIDLITRAGMLHDIGKISTPDSILLKPGQLSRLEYKLIQDHVTSGYELLRNIDIYSDIAEIIRHHHEYFDGSGYPQGLQGDAIPFLSQIMSVADAFDAMTTNRIYKRRKNIDDALEEIEELAGKQFHPKIARAAKHALSSVIIHDYKEQLPQTKLEEERFAYFYKDPISGLYNHDYLNLTLARNQHDALIYHHLTCIYLHNFNQYNKQHSWNRGDIKLQNVAQILQERYKSMLIFRVFGDDFIILGHEKIPENESNEILKQCLEGTQITSSSCYLDLTQHIIESLEDIEKIT